MQRFICLHGHFYQPPRENPWLEAVELQDSAQPFHDWNERIVAECYGPNAHARLLDGDGRIQDIVSNYSRMSFNVGPTLLTWMKENTPDIHEAIVQADAESRRRFSGHGSALAQCYNHMIMPLANRRDKHTQVAWGIRDFEFRFGRRPEGMWLPECAADVESLDVLAEQGIRFTILSPYQASRVRAIGDDEWHDVNGGRIDPRQPYLVRLESGRSIVVFFYDGLVSRAVAFEHLLSNGDHFAHRLCGAFNDGAQGDQLVHIATDGESYGHHFRYGEMALARALDCIERGDHVRLTNYAEYLDSHPAAHEVEIHPGSAWSCAHGIERWRSDCGCNSGGHPGWNQQWRHPLREGLDWLRDQLAPLYEREAARFLQDPWRARDDYIEIILNRARDNVAGFLRLHSGREMSQGERVNALRLLELQRHAMLMFTSCGWFFDELSGIETLQVMQYAARAMQLARDLFETDLEPGFLEHLARARSNISGFGDGRRIYERFVRPAIMDREKVGAHYAVSSLFESYPDQARIYSFTIEQQDRQIYSAGKARLAIGRINVTFEITHNSDVITYGVLHLGEHNLNCGVRHYQGPEAYTQLVSAIRDAFNRADFPAIIRLMDRHFGESNYSLKNLFRDEQRKVLNQVLASAQDHARQSYRLITDRYGALLRFLADLPAPAPRTLRLAFEALFNSELRGLLEKDFLETERIRCLLEEAEQAQVPIDADTLGYAMKAHMDRRANEVAREPENVAALRALLAASQLLRTLPFEVNLWRPQNTWHVLNTQVRPRMQERANAGDATAQAWLNAFFALGEQLGFHIELGTSQPEHSHE